MNDSRVLYKLKFKQFRGEYEVLKNEFKSKTNVAGKIFFYINLTKKQLSYFTP